MVCLTVSITHPPARWTLIFVTVYTPVFVFFVYLYIVRRNYQPLKSRSLILVLSNLFFLYLYWSILWVRESSKKVTSCILFKLSLVFSLMMIFATLLARLNRVKYIYLFNLAKLKYSRLTSKQLKKMDPEELLASPPTSLETDETDESGDKNGSAGEGAEVDDNGGASDDDSSSSRAFEDDYYIKSRYKIGWKYSLKHVVITGAIHFAIALWAVSGDDTTFGCIITPKIFVILFLLQTGYYIMLLRVYLKIKDMPENFWMRSELKAMSIIPFAGGSITYVIELSGYADSFEAHVHISTGVISGLTLLGMMITELFIPVVMSFKHEYEINVYKQRLEDIGEDISEITYEKVMHNIFMREFFRVFSVKDLCAENIEFWTSVHAFKKRPKMKSCKRIMKKFIYPNSPFEINIQSRTRSNIIEEYKRVVEHGSELDGTMFDSALKEVDYLMRYNTFLGFRRSQDFVVMQERIAEEKNKMLLLDKIYGI